MRKKLIEVALPLDAINAASARETSSRHGHPSTLHLWWARRPLTGRACGDLRATRPRAGNRCQQLAQRAQEREHRDGSGGPRARKRSGPQRPPVFSCRAPCAADVAEGRRKVLEMLRETVKVAIDARDDGAAAAVADVLQRLGMWRRLSSRRFLGSPETGVGGFEAGWFGGQKRGG